MDQLPVADNWATCSNVNGRNRGRHFVVSRILYDTLVSKEAKISAFWDRISCSLDLRDFMLPSRYRWDIQACKCTGMYVVFIWHFKIWSTCCRETSVNNCPLTSHNIPEYRGPRCRNSWRGKQKILQQIRYIRVLEAYLTTLTPSRAVVMKSGNLNNFLESSGPLQACNGAALPLLNAYTASLLRRQ